MVKPATARRRNKIQQQQQQQAAAAAHAAQLKEDEASGLHDEADVMSFRSAATHRFLLNQELIENITEKWVHADNITKPVPFPSIQTTKQNIDEIKNELYFGNLNLMQQKLDKLEKEVAELNNDTDEDKQVKNIKTIHKAIETMANSLSNQEKIDLSEIEKTYTEITTKKISTSSYKIRTLPNLKVDKSEAPANYWEEIAKAKESSARAAEEAAAAAAEAAKAAEEAEAAQQAAAALPQNPDLVITDSFMQGPSNAQDYTQGAFETDDIDMIDDVGFGLHSTLDDQDFLSQIDHSME